MQRDQPALSAVARRDDFHVVPILFPSRSRVQTLTVPYRHGFRVQSFFSSPSSFILPLALLLLFAVTCAAHAARPSASIFPAPLDSYGDSQMSNVWDVLKHRVQQEPFNLWATLVFLAAIIHTFLTHKFLHWAHVAEQRHQVRLGAGHPVAPTQLSLPSEGTIESAAQQQQATTLTCVEARLLHFFGEVEAVFGIWVIPLFILMSVRLGWLHAVNYLDHGVRYIEPVFVVVIMIISSTRPIVRLAEQCLSWVAKRGGGGPGAWWFTILTIGPLLGSLITEPAAMTISALLLGQQFFALKPPPRLAYATLGLLFVNVSVGGVLTHFAAPPVLMVAAAWDWDTFFMLQHFGWEAITGILVSNFGYYFIFRREIRRLAEAATAGASSTKGDNGPPVPAWVTIVHLLVLGWTVITAHYPILVVGGFLFFVAFLEVTADYQAELQVRSPILVGFFLAGLVIHGGLQGWWIAPVLGRLKELPLMLGAIGLTAFNDNAAITYLATLVPAMALGMKHAVVAGAVTGGGLTVIANAPNPAGQSLLSKHFPGGISPLGLLLGALPATIVLALCFIFMR